jgi:Holliday junction resolvasome RuvABC endonuclease subunit
MLVLGIDPGLACTAYAIADNYTMKPRIIRVGASIAKASEGDAIYRARKHAKAMLDFVIPMPEYPRLVMEISFSDYARNVKSAIETALLIGLIIGKLDCLLVRGWELVAPATWATQCLGAGNKKPDRFTCEQLFDVVDPKKMLANEHKRDAVCIAGWGARKA